MTTRLYYYTGTGNSLWVARQLARRLDVETELISLGSDYEMPDEDYVREKEIPPSGGLGGRYDDRCHKNITLTPALKRAAELIRIDGSWLDFCADRRQQWGKNWISYRLVKF